jgi:hypothetical protein
MYGDGIGHTNAELLALNPRGIPAALAWQATRRMKRGLRETSNTKKEPLP